MIHEEIALEELTSLSLLEDASRLTTQSSRALNLSAGRGHYCCQRGNFNIHQGLLSLIWDFLRDYCAKYNLQLIREEILISIH